MTNASNSIFKVAFIGHQGVGKSSICHRMVKNAFEDTIESTIGSAFFSFSTNDGRKVNIWDTAGQERYFSLAPMYTNGSNVIVIVYDMSDPYSLDLLINKWIPYVEKNVNTAYNTDKTKMLGDADKTKIVLVGNKKDIALPQYRNIDVPKQVDSYVEVSAKTGENCDLLIQEIVKALPSAVAWRKGNNTITLGNATSNASNASSRRKCCINMN